MWFTKLGGYSPSYMLSTFYDIKTSKEIINYTVKNPHRFYGKNWQLPAGAFAVNFAGARRTFTGITSLERVMMCKIKIRCVSSHPYNVLYVTYLALHCPTMRNYYCK